MNSQGCSQLAARCPFITPLIYTKSLGQGVFSIVGYTGFTYGLKEAVTFLNMLEVHVHVKKR